MVNYDAVDEKASWNVILWNKFYELMYACIYIHASNVLLNFIVLNK